MPNLIGTQNQAGLQKLKISAYKNSDYSGSLGSITVMLNPNQITHTLSTQFSGEEKKPIGLPDVSKSFNTIDAETMSFELMFDGTGVVNGKTATDVADQLNSFYNLCYAYNGDIHQPNFLILTWGNITFKGRLTSCSITYSMFSGNGAPLRAKANVTFEQYIDVKVLKAELKINSPDMTHQRIVKEGDTLPLLCYEIYGDSSYYIQVAAANQMGSFRSLKPGTKIFFPPIKK